MVLRVLALLEHFVLWCSEMDFSLGKVTFIYVIIASVLFIYLLVILFKKDKLLCY